MTHSYISYNAGAVILYLMLLRTLATLALASTLATGQGTLSSLGLAAQAAAVLLADHTTLATLGLALATSALALALAGMLAAGHQSLAFLTGSAVTFAGLGLTLDSTLTSVLS